VTVKPPEKPETPPNPPQKPVIERKGKSFQLPDNAQTSRKDLFRLVNALERAYVALDFQKPYPLIRIVNRRHKALEKGAIAAAIIDDLGKEYLYFQRKQLRIGAPIDGLVIHELSHLKAWRLHGTGISVHGHEFNSICRKAATSSDCEAEG